MFSCCALFNTDDNGADVEHLKGLNEMEVTRDAGDISIALDENGLYSSRGSFEGTPLATSPRAVAAQQRLLEATAAAQVAESAALQATIIKSKSEVEGKEAAQAEAAAQQATREAEADAVAAEDARAAAQAAADTASAERADQTLRALREAEDAAHEAAAEAEKRRFEEEASARAARQAESEARKALWRAEEAQKVKEQAGSKAAEEAAAARRIAEEEAELSKREAAATMTEKAREYLTGRLSSDEGLRLQKHGRNGKTLFRTLRSPDGEFQTLTWGKTLHYLREMQEVRRGSDADPAHPGETGTSELRRSKTGRAALDRSFSLLFPSRSLDFTVATKEECEQLVLGFRALSASQRS